MNAPHESVTRIAESLRFCATDLWATEENRRTHALFLQRVEPRYDFSG